MASRKLIHAPACVAYEDLVNNGQRYFAKIRKTSKYAGQNAIAKARAREYGLPFPVRLTEEGPLDQYCVKGGPGGQYRPEDLELYTERGGKLVRAW